MGRKSREKRDRRVNAAASHPADSDAISTTLIPDEVYRFFDEPQYAEALVNGFVWLSTLETCRAYEDPARGDSGEGTMSYNSGFIQGNGSNSRVREIGGRAGIRIGPRAKGIKLNNNSMFRKIADAWVLCTTLLDAPEKMEAFGPYAVRISHPKTFFERLTRVVGDTVNLAHAARGPVIYRERAYKGLDPEPGRIGFVKPPDLYAEQREYRMLWFPAGSHGIQPQVFKCDDIKEFVERVR